MTCHSTLRLAATVLSAAALLSACGGADAPAAATSGTAGTSASTPSLAAAAVPPWRLFLPDLARATLDATATPTAGGVLAGIALSGGTGNDVQLDAARDELYVLSGRTVAVFADAGTLAAHASPVRSFTLPPSLTTPRTLYLDTASDTLYVGGDLADGGGEILAYAEAHTQQGLRPEPSRTLLIDGGVAFFTLDTQRQRLYVVNDVVGVHVYANADTAAGVLLPVTTIPALGTGLAVDASRDRLYVADPFAGLILVDRASAAAPVVSATLTIADAGFVTVDPTLDRLWVSAGANLYAIAHASELTAATTLDAPAVAASGSVLGAVVAR